MLFWNAVQRSNKKGNATERNIESHGPGFDL